VDLTAIDARAKFSERRVERMRNALRKKLGKEAPFAVVSSGSYSRREASEQSDIDFFAIYDSSRSSKDVEESRPKIVEAIHSVVPKPPATGGVFDQEWESIRAMERNIGGDNDTNAKLTRRVLFLLEGDWLYGEERFKKYRSQIIRRYIRETITDHQLIRFFLNDLIRYYRTICVDFEFKTVEVGKDWGTRNLKLIFPRKLLYFSGILVAAETLQQTYQAKVSRTTELLDLAPIPRIQAVCGSRSDRVLLMYSDFLTKFASGEMRKDASRATVDRRTHSEEFKRLRYAGHRFSWELAKLLRETYDVGHPIHNAVMF
jgi:hypothetical protein